MGRIRPLDFVEVVENQQDRFGEVAAEGGCKERCVSGSHIDVGGCRAGIGGRVDVQTRADGRHSQTQFVCQSPAEGQN